MIIHKNIHSLYFKKHKITQKQHFRPRPQHRILFLWGELGPYRTQSPGPRPASTLSDILVHPAIWPQRTLAKNWGWMCPFRGERAESPSNTMSPRLRPITVASDILIHTAVWPEQAWTENWGLCPFWGGAGSTSNTKSSGLRPTSIPSGILVHPAIWPQRTLAKNWGGLCPFRGGGARSPSNSVALAEAYLSTKQYPDT